MRYLTLFILLLFFVGFADAQTSSLSIKGQVVDSETSNPMSSVTVGVKDFPRLGVLTDSLGQFELKLPHDNCTLKITFTGYYSKEIHLKKQAGKQLRVELESKAMDLNEVEVTARRKDENVKSVQLGADRLQVKAISKIPVLFGEKDILKTLQLLPGVQAVGEGNTGFYVRGGSNDQNLILLDKANVYNPSHLFGFFSTFNSDDVDGMTLYKGTIPAQYGGRLSSVLDVDMRDGDMDRYSVSGGIGLISSRLTVEGPIQKGKSSFIVSGRRTYADALANLAGVKEVKGSKMYFYDLNAKLSYVISPRDKLTLTAYHGRDEFGMKKLVGLGWGNTVGSLKWTHELNKKAFLNTSLTFTDYRYDVDVNFTEDFTVESHITDCNFNEELSLFPNKNNTIRLGFQSIFHTVVPGQLKASDPSRFNVKPFEHRASWENSVYASHQSKLTDNFEMSYGLRLTTFSVLGGGNFYNYDQNANITDTIRTRRGQFVKTYWNLEPRLGMTYSLTKSSSLKLGFTRTEQNMHLISAGNMSMTPSDRWLANTNYVKPEVANQVSFGYFKNFNDNMYEFSAEVYYKDLHNQIDYKDGTTNIFEIDNVEPYLLFGKGRAYGLELFLKKRYGRFNGWVGYTLSRSEKKINGINNGRWYAANQDRTNDLSVVGIYDINKKWSVSGTWIYATGAPMTFPSGSYVVDGHQIPYYAGRNLYRSPAYHRLDLGATCVLKKTKTKLSELVFSVYNAYGRKNAFMYGLRPSKDNPDKSEVYMVYLFRMIPSITWDFKF